MVVFRAKDRDKHFQALLQYLPNGKVVCSKNLDFTNFYKLFKGIGGSFARVDQLIQQVWDGVSLIDTEDINYIVAWEGAVGIPDSCFDVSGSLEERRQNIIVKLRSLGVLTEEDFIGLINLLGFQAEIKQGVSFSIFPLVFPLTFFNSVKAARFTMVVELPSELAPTSSFPLTFPFEFEEAGGGIVRCLLEKVKPSNVKIIYNYTL